MSQCLAYDPRTEVCWWRCFSDSVRGSRYCAEHRERIAECVAIPVMAWDVKLDTLLGSGASAST